jgi:hypothetical protein
MSDLNAEALEKATRELLLHRGEQPSRVLRGGMELWETYRAPVTSAIRAYLSALHLSGKEGEAVETLTEWADLWRAEGQPAEADEAMEIAALITALVVERDRWEAHATNGDEVLSRERDARLVAEAKLERVKRERDEWKGKWAEADELAKVNAEFLAHSDKRAEAAEAEVTRLREALEPFAFRGMTWLHGNKVHITVATEAIERARAELGDKQ